MNSEEYYRKFCSDYYSLLSEVIGDRAWDIYSRDQDEKEAIEKKEKERQIFLKEYDTTIAQVRHFVNFGYPRLKKLFTDIQSDICNTNNIDDYKYWYCVYNFLVSLVRGKWYLEKMYKMLSYKQEESNINLGIINIIKAHPKIAEHLPEYRHDNGFWDNEELIKNLLSRTAGCCALYATSLDYLKELARHESKDIRLGLLLRSELPPEIFEILASSNDIEIIKAIAKHRNAPQKMLCEYAKPTQDPEVIKLAITNPSLPLEIVEEYSWRADKKFTEIQKIAKKVLIVRGGFKECKRLSNDLNKEIKEAASKRLLEIGKVLAKDSEITSDTIQELLAINNYDIDESLVDNPNTTKEQLDTLFDRFQKNVYKVAHWDNEGAIASIFKHHNTSADIKNQLKHTKNDIIGRAVVTDPETTKEEVVWLALNGHWRLCYSILEREDITTFPVDVLVRLVKQCDSEEVLTVVAKRPDLPIEVAQELLESAYWRVALRVLETYDLPYEVVEPYTKSDFSSLRDIAIKKTKEFKEQERKKIKIKLPTVYNIERKDITNEID